MSGPILQSHLPNPPWLDPARWRLPGVEPLRVEDWLIRDEVFSAQMALRDELIATRADEVHALEPSAEPAARECYDLVLSALAADPGYTWQDGSVTRPDGVTVALDRAQPLLTLGRLTQSDICLLEPGEDGHVLTGAILCFPAYWTLVEKIGRALPRIHKPVPEYDADIGRRVQRLFDAIRPGQLLGRMNANIHASPDLFTPKREDEPESRVAPGEGRFVRSERQILRQLPDTGAVAFTIHTYMVAIEDLSPESRSTLARLMPI